MSGSRIRDVRRVLHRGFHTAHRHSLVKSFGALDVEQTMDQTPRPLVLNVLSQDDYDREHIPGSENVPGDVPDFVTRVEQLAGSSARPIVVYCASVECPVSAEAVRKLNAAGFEHVAEFPGGMAEWKAGGRPVQGKHVSGVRSP